MTFFSGVRNLRALPRPVVRGPKGNERNIAEVGPGVTVTIDLARPKRRSEDDREVTSRHAAVTDREVDLEKGI